MGLTSCNSDTKKNDQNPEKLEVKNKIAQTKTSFGIRGNCSMCKTKIEKQQMD